MKKAFLAVFLLGFAACGKIGLEHSGDVKVDGTVEVSFNLDNIKGYFEIECQQEEPDHVEACTNRKIAAFLNYLSSSVPQPSPTPSSSH